MTTMPPEPTCEPDRFHRLVVVGDRGDVGVGQHLGRDAARNDAFEPAAAEHAAAVLVDELGERIAVLDLVDAGPRDVARDRHQLRARAFRSADLAELLGAHAHDDLDIRQRLDVVDDGRPLVQAAHRQPRRPVARVALLALDRGDQRRSLATDIRTGAAIDDEVAGEVGAHDVLAQKPGGIGLVDRALQAVIRQIELAADVDERMAHLQREGRDQHRLDQLVRRVLENPAILERARLAFVGVGAQVVRLGVAQLDHRPFATDRKCGAAVAEDAGRRDFLRHLLRRHRGQHATQGLITAAGAHLGKQVRGRRDREGHQQLAARHFSCPSSVVELLDVMFS